MTDDSIYDFPSGHYSHRVWTIGQFTMQATGSIAVNYWHFMFF